MKRYIIIIEFDIIRDNAQVIADLQRHFQNVNIVCEDCLKILQYMREAQRGAIITRENIKMHRTVITEIENLRNQKKEPVVEIILTFDDTPINIRLLGDFIRFETISDSSEWAEKLHHLLSKIFPDTGIKFITVNAQYEVLGYYADIERRLNEGDDIYDGEFKTHKRSIGDFVKHFPQYAYFIK
jgi:hypothetical protein